MTMTIQKDRLLVPPNPTAVRVVVPPSEDQSAQAPGADSARENLFDRADGDLLQARALAEGHPGSPTALARLAGSEVGFGNRVSASEAAQKILENEAIDAPALIVASQVFVVLGEIGCAERALHKVLAAPAAGNGAKRAAAVLATRIAARQGDSERALELLADSGGGTASALKGAVLAQMGRYHDAIHELRAALKSVPDAPATLCSLGYAYAAAGSTRKAIRATTAAAALAPADQTAGLNLAAMLFSQGETCEAVSAIDRLADRHPDDIRLDLAAAAILYISGDTAAALKRLRRAEASTAARDAAPAQAEELRLNISLLKNPAMPRADVFALALKALKRCDYRSETIARLLASTAQSAADLPALETAYTKLAEHRSRPTLLAVERQVAFLRFEFDRSLDAAAEWVREEPFSAEAHIAATYLLSMHKGDYQGAARIGLAGIRRGIGDDVLRNNVAFALAMDGNPDEAERVLPDPSECELALTTAGLIKAARGDLEKGISLYEESARLMRQKGDHDLADIIDIGRAFAMLAASKAIPEDHLVDLKGKADTDPRLTLVRNAIKREENARHLR